MSNESTIGIWNAWSRPCRAVHFVHDEFILECPIGRQTQTTKALRGILPDVAAAGRWSKAAEE